MMSLKQFCKENDIKYMSLNIDGYKTKNVDFLDRTSKDLKKLKKNSLIKTDGYVMLDTSKHVFIDVDFKDGVDYGNQMNNMITNLCNTYPHYKSMTKQQGKHIILNQDQYINLNRTNTRVQTQFKDIELLTGQPSIVKMDKFLSSDYIKIPMCKYENVKPIDMNTIVKTERPTVKKILITPRKSPKKTQTPQKTEEADKMIFKELADNIKVEYLTEYSCWLKIMMALKNLNMDNVADEISQKAPDKYDKTNNDKIYNSIKSNNSITCKTLFYYSKLSNEKKHKKILKKHTATEALTEQDYTNIILNLTGDNWIYQDDVVYRFNSKWWEELEDNQTKAYFYNLLQKHYKSILTDTETEYNNTDDEDKKFDIIKKINTLKNILREIGKSSLRKNILDIFKQTLSIQQNKKLNSKPNILCFNNVCYDLYTNKQIPFDKKHYNTLTTGYDLDLDANPDIAQKLLNSIFIDEDERNTYLSILRTGMYGQTLEKFIIANGKGRNGKGVLHEAVLNMLGDYGYTLPSNVLLAGTKSGANPEIANLHNKRFVVCREPDEKKSLSLSTIKEITGGNEINARQLYSSNTKTKLSLTLIMECNKRCSFNSRVDTAAADRIVDVGFKSYYTTDKTQIDEDDPYIQMCNTQFKTDKYREQIKHSLFMLLINHNSDIQSIDVCDSIKQRTEEYLQDNDAVLNVLNEFYDKTNSKNDFITLDELYNTYKAETNDKLTKKSFKDDLDSNPFIPFRLRYKYWCDDVRKDIRNVIVGYKLKPVDVFKEEEEEDCLFNL